MIYRVDFLDHTQDYNMAIECAVYGLLIAEDEDSLTFETWSMTDPQQREDMNDTSCFTIVRSAMKRLVPLFEGQEIDFMQFPLRREPGERAG